MSDAIALGFLIFMGIFGGVVTIATFAFLIAMIIDTCKREDFPYDYGMF